MNDHFFVLKILKADSFSMQLLAIWQSLFQIWRESFDLNIVECDLQ